MSVWGAILLFLSNCTPLDWEHFKFTCSYLYYRFLGGWDK